MMEAIEVTARFTIEGRVDPLQLIWKGRRLPIESTGRRWAAEDGQHILAMLPGNQAIELLFIPGESRWYLRVIGPGISHA